MPNIVKYKLNNAEYEYTSGDGSSYAGTDLNLLALYPDLLIYKTGNFYTKTRIS